MQHPVAFGCGISALKTSGSDFFTQRWFEGRNLSQINWRRNGIFFTWGFLYLGGVQYFVYVKLFAKYLFPSAAGFVAKPLRAKLADRAGQITVLKQVGLDQFVHHPFVVFPTFYQVKELIEGGTPMDGVRKCWKNWYEDCMLSWSVWIPVFLFNFSFCPLWMRVPFVAIFSVFFTCLWSLKRGETETLADE